jgi:hypothetical protein
MLHNKRNIFIIFRTKFMYNMFKCKTSTSTEALLGLSNDMFHACKEIVNIYKACVIRGGKIIF